MWKELPNLPSYVLQFSKKCSYRILITDFIKIWEASYGEDEFLNCLKESNFGLEINANELIEKGTQMLLSPNDLKTLHVSHKDSLLNVHMIRVYIYPLHLQIKLKEGSAELFFQEVTLKLLKTIKDLRCSEQELREVLKKKEKEIGQYKSLGGKIRYTSLPPYKDEIHMEKHSTYNSNFGDMMIPNSVLERTVNVSRNVLEANTDCKKVIKQEPVSQEIISNEITINRLNEIKQEPIKTEPQSIIPIRSKRKKMLNL
ncbi:uncharacterized protein LOC123655335 [Melitaea cinxia]|uniref:uncharacterized protein LOC123655335 n=1 Tax=Melitaea cinxia TaxID=113334 RepID=UPI001E272948|nr:uncharacterized protein LOC123655335 [Melitaea cinxia]XP_045447103.1 uncharacterized protein LOC123655335 [Melitaea cinxia]